MVGGSIACGGWEHCMGWVGALHVVGGSIACGGWEHCIGWVEVWFKCAFGVLALTKLDSNLIKCPHI